MMRQMRHTKRERRVYYCIRTAILSCVLLAVILAGCSEGECVAVTLPKLWQPGVRMIAALPNWMSLDYSNTFLTTFMAESSGSYSPNILFGGAGEIFAIDLTTGIQRSLDIGARCLSQPAVTPDNQGIACDSDAGIIIAPLLPSARSPSRVLLPLTGNNPWLNIAWAPDGIHFAILHNGIVELYLANASYTSALLTAYLDIRAATGCATTDTAFCAVSYLSWSPDGKWLAYVFNYNSTSVDTIIAINLAPLLPAAIITGVHPFTKVLTNTTVIPIAVSARPAVPAWQPRTSRLTYIVADGTTIVTLPLPSGAPTLLLRQETIGFGQIARAPDGREIAFTAISDYYPPQPTETPVPTDTPNAVPTATLIIPLAAHVPLSTHNVGSVSNAAHTLGFCTGPSLDLYVYTSPAA